MVKQKKKENCQIKSSKHLIKFSNTKNHLNFFDSLVTIARVNSHNTFRIFNWILRKKITPMNTMALYITSIKNTNNTDYSLIDSSANIRNPEYADLDAKNWYGSYI